jgi:hypothetical protein
MTPQPDRRTFREDDHLRLVDPPVRTTDPGPLSLDADDLDAPVEGATSAFFVDLDAYTQYFDVYDLVPDARYMGMYGVLGGVIAAWNRVAETVDPAAHAAALQTLRARVQEPQSAQALQGLDAMMVALVRQHFPSGSGVDADGYLDVVEAFGRDVLPPDPDRLARVLALDPDDPRKDMAERHRMDGASMWFTWAAVVDCASLLSESDPSLAPGQEARTLMLAGCAAGSAFDFVFRAKPGDPRGRTRPEYTPDLATLSLLRSSARAWAADLDEARSNARDLHRIAVSP